MLFYQPQLNEGSLFLDHDESRHCVKVLRKRSGDVIQVTDGRGFFYDALLTDTSTELCTFAIQKKVAAPKKKYSLHIAIAPTKNPDRTEWFVEKAVEIGVDAISFVQCKNSERISLKLERIQKLAVSAMKQSQQAWLPVIHPLRPLTELIHNTPESTRFIAYVDKTNPDHLVNVAAPEKDYVVLIGPEGDFSPEELELALQQGFRKVSLGPNRLRTETAGLVVCQSMAILHQRTNA
jgi:16S rRNA (uracil1498-N3)-methyltransferase